MFDPEILMTNGREARAENRLEESRDLFAQAVAECRWVKDNTLLARALKGLAQAERDLQHPTTALQCYREAAQIYRALDDRLAYAHTIRHSADVHRGQNTLPDAARLYEEALEIYRTHPDALPLDHANALRGFALLQDAAGHPEEALFLWQGASHLYSAAGVQAGFAEAEQHIAFLLGR